MNQGIRGRHRRRRSIAGQSPEGLNLNSPRCNRGFAREKYGSTPKGLNSIAALIENRPTPERHFDPSGVAASYHTFSPDFIRGYSNLCPPGTAS